MTHSAMSRADAGRRRLACALAVAILVLATSSPAPAHDRKNAGAIRLTIGWSDEPAVSGSRNAVEVDLADAAGKPVADLDGPLAVDVSFGDERMALPLVPVRGRPGAFHAWLVPTRAGTYSFRVTGRVKGQPIDVASTCSDRTFDCVVEASALQFPAKDPSAGQLADGIGRALPRAERAMETASRAWTIAIAAIAVAALSLAATVVLAVRTRT